MPSNREITARVYDSTVTLSFEALDDTEYDVKVSMDCDGTCDIREMIPYPSDAAWIEIYEWFNKGATQNLVAQAYHQEAQDAVADYGDMRCHQERDGD